MRKICIVTGTRAEYGLLYWLMKEIQSDPELRLQILVTGMHLSHEFGLTWEQIEADGFTIDRKVEMLLSSDTPVGITKSIGVGMMGLADAYSELKPDLIVILGDRFEAFAAATAGLIFRIPLAHLHGGETTEGASDEAMRHSITKMSHLHFTAAECYRKRVIQLGEYPDRVFSVGGLGIDNIKKMNLISRADFETAINFKLGVKNLLITYHPVTLENRTAEHQMTELLEALDSLAETHFIFTMPNADVEGRIIKDMIDNYVTARPEKAVSFMSLGQLRYLSAIQFVDAVVGNSSSGLIEVPSFRKGTINIGDRQKGRLRASSVIDCKPLATDIRAALEKLYSADFQKRLQMVENPYGDGGASLKIKEIIKKVEISDILKKSFFDIDFR